MSNIPEDSEKSTNVLLSTLSDWRPVVRVSTSWVPQTYSVFSSLLSLQPINNLGKLTLAANTRFKLNVMIGECGW